MGAKSWKIVKKALKDNGVTISIRRGTGEAKLTRRTEDGVSIYVLQHKCCKSPSSTVWANHVAAIKRRFDIDEI